MTEKKRYPEQHFGIHSPARINLIYIRSVTEQPGGKPCSRIIVGLHVMLYMAPYVEGRLRMLFVGYGIVHLLFKTLQIRKFSKSTFICNKKRSFEEFSATTFSSGTNPHGTATLAVRHGAADRRRLKTFLARRLLKLKRKQ